MQPPVQQQMPVETLSHMLRMTGELRQEVEHATTSKALGKHSQAKASSATTALEREAEGQSPQSVTSSSSA